MEQQTLFDHLPDEAQPLVETTESNPYTLEFDDWIDSGLQQRVRSVVARRLGLPSESDEIEFPAEKAEEVRSLVSDVLSEQSQPNNIQAVETPWKNAVRVEDRDWDKVGDAYVG